MLTFSFPIYNHGENFKCDYNGFEKKKVQIESQKYRYFCFYFKEFDLIT